MVHGAVSRQKTGVYFSPWCFCDRKKGDLQSELRIRGGALSFRPFLPTFNSFLQQQRDRALVVDQHTWTWVLIQSDVCHPKVLLICEYYGSAKENINMQPHKQNVHRELTS